MDPVETFKQGFPEYRNANLEAQKVSVNNSYEIFLKPEGNGKKRKIGEVGDNGVPYKV